MTEPIADLLGFLRDRLDDDERIARAAAEHANGSEAWDLVSFVGGDLDPGKHFSLSIGGRALNASSGDAPDDDTPVVAAELRHMANFDPARVLAEVESRRRILDLCERALAAAPSQFSSFARGQDDGFRQALEEAIKALALPYQSNPSYRREWAP